MNIASIDIGSNTMILLIAKIENKKLHPLCNMYETPRLGKDLKINGEIRDDKIEELLKILLNFKKKINEFNCAETIITATNAMRIAKNSGQIIKKVKQKLNLDIKIIQGEKEAELSFLGASSGFPEIKQKIVIDIGGGSTEIIYGNKENLFYRHSFQVGTVSLTEKYLTKFPYSANIKDIIYNHLGNIFAPVKDNIPLSIPTIAVAGTPTTLFCMINNMRNYDEEKVEGAQLSRNELLDISNKLVSISPNIIKQSYGDVVKGREDVIFAGSLILLYLSEVFLIDSIYISERGLRYGNIVRFIDSLK